MTAGIEATGVGIAAFALAFAFIVAADAGGVFLARLLVIALLTPAAIKTDSANSGR